MTESRFARVFAWTARHRTTVFAAVVLLVAVCAAGVTRTRFETDIAGMMPADPALRRDHQLIQENVFAGKVVLSFELIGTDATLQDLIRYADAVAARLPGPLVSEIVAGPELAPQDLIGFIGYAPQLLAPDRLASWRERMSPARVEEALRAARRQLLGFQGIFVAGLVRADPLGLFSEELAALRSLSGAFGRNVVFSNGHFTSQDGRNLMLILGTPVPVTDGPRSRDLLAHIERGLGERPPFARVDVIAGHTHAVANETLVKQDIARTAAVATVAFLVLLIGFFRDVRAGIFFIIPAFAILISLVCAGLVFGRVSALVAALSTVIIGIADDYGIHIYTAIRTTGHRDVVVHEVRPLLLAALFTSGIFLVFFLSNIPGYHQLAFITLLSIWLCLGFVLLVFPHLVPLTPMKLPKLTDRGLNPGRDRRRVWVWCGLLLALGAGALQMRFSSVASTLDGVGADVRAGEERFNRTWAGGQRQAIFVAEAPTRDQALEIARSVYRETAELAAEISSLAPLWASPQERTANTAAWSDLWQSGAGRSLRDSIRAGAAKLGFAPEAFRPFLDLTERRTFPSFEDVPLLARLSERFISTTGTAARVFTYFPEDPGHLEAFEGLTKKYPGTFLFSETGFERRLGDSLNREAVKLAASALALICLAGIFFLRRVRLAVMALASALTCLLAIAAVFGVAGLPLTPPAVVALMIAVGLSLNYGVFMLYSLRARLETGSAEAVAVSAATTLIGALSLLAARHPALFSIGVSLSTGLAAGWLCAELVIPALYRLWGEDRRAHDAV